jgi:hypothetical protein
MRYRKATVAAVGWVGGMWKGWGATRQQDAGFSACTVWWAGDGYALQYACLSSMLCCSTKGLNQGGQIQ